MSVYIIDRNLNNPTTFYAKIYHLQIWGEVMTEAQTRISLIDTRLLASGWDVSDHSKVLEEYLLLGATSVKHASFPYKNTQFSDYVLLGRDGKPLAVVGAKATSKDAELGREQAKQYAQRIESESDAPLPFCFYTNGDTL